MYACPTWLCVLCLALAGIVSAADSNCKEVTFTLSGAATNKNLTGVPLDQGLDAIVKYYEDAAPLAVSGPQTIKGTYCSATTFNSNNNKLQVLFHSITGARSGWSALGGVGTDYDAYKPEMYSYVRFANAKGYPTLAIDRLGNGKSSHPDPILVVQAPYEMALYNDLASQLRAANSQLPKKYDYLIYIGNSYGSQLGTGIAGMYPEAYNEFVLTGFTSTVQKGFAGVALAAAAPADVVDPARFGNLPPGYLTTSSKQGRTNSFFGSKAQVSFEDIVAQLFFDRKDTVSVGQFVSVYAFPFDGAGFTGRVFTLDGEEDQAFCGPGSPVLGPAMCGTQPRDTGLLFPNADYNYATVDKIGHAVQLHTRAQVLYGVAHQFLAGQEFMSMVPAK